LGSAAHYTGRYMKDPDAVKLVEADCREAIKRLADNSVDAVVTDPPYALVSIQSRFGKTSLEDATKTSEAARNKANQYASLSAGFMGSTWDTGEVAFDVAFWREVLRVLKPGGHLLAFGGTRTYHRLACAIEDAGFEVRDQVGWCYGTGFPKSHNISKAVDRKLGAKPEIVGEHSRKNLRKNGAGFRNLPGLASESRGAIPLTAPTTSEAKRWDGWGTALKPAWEPICLARKPLSEPTVAANVLKWGTGALNIDACRVESGPSPSVAMRARGKAPISCKPGEYGDGHAIQNRITPERWCAERPGEQQGRWPANLVHDGSPEVLGAFPDAQGGQPQVIRRGITTGRSMGYGSTSKPHIGYGGFADSGSAARFFFSAKAGPADRFNAKHPTVKPIALLQWLCRLITPPNGLVLDPFAGSGTTGQACFIEGFHCILFEKDHSYAEHARMAIKSLKDAALPGLAAKTRHKQSARSLFEKP